MSSALERLLLAEMILKATQGSCSSIIFSQALYVRRSAIVITSLFVVCLSVTLTNVEIKQLLKSSRPCSDFSRVTALLLYYYYYYVY